VVFVEKQGFLKLPDRRKARAIRHVRRGVRQ
jgi:hypothetical protein